MKNSLLSTKIISLIFIVLLLFFFFTNFSLLDTPFHKLSTGEISFSDFTQEVGTSYRDNLKQNNSFVSLNGFCARIIGTRVSNEVLMLNNGMLTESIEFVPDITRVVDEITVFNQYLTENNINYFFVVHPYKPDKNDTLVPVGIFNGTNSARNNLVSSLTNQNIPVLDLRNYVASDAEQIEKYFYKTDHHWNAEGAFVGFQEIVKYLHKLYPNEPLDSEIMNRNSWNLNIIEDFFLGSYGRRVGLGYVGTDDLIYLTPKFETEISCSIPYSMIYRKGSFSEATLDMSYLTNGLNYYDNRPYCIHTGNDYAHVVFRNENAPSDLKVLMIKNSFGLPLEGFLSTMFKKVETLDLRYLTEEKALEKIIDFNPDVVISMSDLLSFDYGLDIPVPNQVETILSNYNFSITESDNAYNHIPICDLKSGEFYTLKIDSVSTTSDLQSCFLAAIYDPVSQTLSQFNIFDIEFYQHNQEDYKWTFKTPDNLPNDLQLLIYPALHGQSTGIGMELEGVSIYKGILSE